MRPEDHSGKTHYCIGDCREDGDAFYFTPDANVKPPVREAPIVKPPSAKIEVKCPQCGIPAQETRRALEYGGLTHFCQQCRGKEPGEPFRFIPSEFPEVFVAATESAIEEIVAKGDDELDAKIAKTLDEGELLRDEGRESVVESFGATAFLESGYLNETQVAVVPVADVVVERKTEPVDELASLRERILAAGPDVMRQLGFVVPPNLPAVESLDSLLTPPVAGAATSAEAESLTSPVVIALGQEAVKKLEAESDVEQLALLDVGEWWSEAWRGMPEFVQEDLQPVRTLYVHFESNAAIREFEKLVGQKVPTSTQKGIWIPPQDTRRFANKRYVDARDVARAIETTEEVAAIEASEFDTEEFTDGEGESK